LRRALGATWDVLTATEEPISVHIDQKVCNISHPLFFHNNRSVHLWAKLEACCSFNKHCTYT